MRRRCGSSSWARPILRRRRLLAIVEAGHEVVAVYTRAPRPGGARGLEMTKTPVHRLAEAPRTAGRHARDAAHARGAGGVSRLRRRCRRRRRLWPDPAAAGARRAEARLPQPSRVPAAALARRGADSAGDHGRRRRDRRRSHAHGGRARYRPGRAASCARRSARPTPPANSTERLAELGARLMAARLARACRRQPGLSRRSRETARLYARKIDKSETRSTGALDADVVRNHIHGLSPSPGAFRRDRHRRARWSASNFSAPRSSTAPGAPGA